METLYNEKLYLCIIDFSSTMKKLSFIVNFDVSVITDDSFINFIDNMREISASINIDNETFSYNTSQRIVVAKRNLKTKRTFDNGNIFNNSSCVIEDFFSVPTCVNK